MCDRLHHAGIREYEALHQWPEQSRDLRGRGEPPRDDDLFRAPLDTVDDGVYHRLARHQLEQSAEAVPYIARYGVVENVVDEFLRAEKDIFVIGDNAETMYSGMAQTAVYDGEFVAPETSHGIGLSDH